MDVLAGGHPRAPEEIRCPACARLLVLRSGPAIRAHFAHRPRQSCRNRPGRSTPAPLRLEQLTLFDLEFPPPTAPPERAELPPPWLTRADAAPPLVAEPVILAPDPAPARRPVRRRRRRAWLPRLIRWIKRRSG